MKTMKIRTSWIFAATLVLSAPAVAWNPMLVSGGTPMTWGISPNVVWNPDGGSLGKLSNAQATQMVLDEFAQWQAVPTATIAYSQGVQIVDPNTLLPTDVTTANYSAVINANDGQNPIIYDNDREIFDMLGTPSGVVGYAGVLRTSGGNIVKGYAVLQGDWYDNEPGGTAPSDPGEISEASFRGMLVHEFGHFTGLAHSSVNHEVSSLPGCGGPTSANIETMSPYLSSDAATLEHDDAMGLSVLYPTAAFQSNFATLRGQLIDRDGVTPFNGANVVLRPDTTDCTALYEQAQGMQSGVAPTAFGGGGSYSFAGLTPGSDYTLLATTINDGGSYRINPPATLGGPDDYYNGTDEDWFSDVDDPAVAWAVTAPATGTTSNGLDIRINNSGGPGVVANTLVGGLAVDKSDGGTPLGSVTLQIDDGGVNSASAYNGTAQAAWLNRFTPASEELPFRIERIDLMFWHSSVGVGRNLRLLVYHDPSGSGDPANAALLHSEDVTVQQLSTVTFNEFTLSSPVLIDSGEFYVGAYDLVADSDTTYIMSSDTSTPSGRSYRQANGTAPGSYSLVGDRTWMVRAHGSTMPTAGAAMLSWGPSCNELAVPDQDFVIYQGSLASLSITPDHEPVVCGTGGLREHTALEVAGDVYWLVAPMLANREGSLGAGTGGSSRAPLSACHTIAPDSCP